MFIIFSDFLMVEQIYFPLKVKRSLINSKKLVYTSCKRLKIFRKLEDIRKIQNFIQKWPSVQSSHRNENFASTSRNLLKNRIELFS